MDDSSSFWAGVILTLIFGFIIGGLILNSVWNERYKAAYEACKQGRIEEIVKKDYPDLWIKYNVPERKER